MVHTIRLTCHIYDGNRSIIVMWLRWRLLGTAIDGLIPGCINILSLNKTVNPQCISRLSCEMSTRRKNHRQWRLFSAMCLPDEISLRNRRIFFY